MNINDFTNLVRKQILKKLDVTDIIIKNVPKDNTTNLTVIEFIDDNSNLVPTVYMEPFFTLYQNGEALDSIVLQIIWEYYRICIESSNASNSISD